MDAIPTQPSTPSRGAPHGNLLAPALAVCGPPQASPEFSGNVSALSVTNRCPPRCEVARWKRTFSSDIGFATVLQRVEPMAPDIMETFFV